MSESQVITFGCRLNAFESEVIRQHVAAADLDNILIVNSCAVTAEATRQVRQRIRREYRRDPKRPILVTGCAAQIDPQSFAAMPEVAGVIGNAEKLEAGTFQAFESASRLRVGDIMTRERAQSPLINGFEGRVRAFVQVQTGCDYRCTFCIIPFGRGNSRSVSPREIISQIHLLLDQGFREIVLTGVDLTSYGRDLPGTPTLGTLVNLILSEVPELARLRLSSLDPAAVDDELFEAITCEERLMPHVHLSIQSGSDMILKRMKRRHLSETVYALTERIRKARPEIAFGADLIAGFPTESDDMFADSLRLVEECDIPFLHVFPYSPRKGTPAVRMPQVPVATRRERARLLRAAGERCTRKLYESMVGRPVAALTEKFDENGLATGRSENFAPVRMSGSIEPGQIIEGLVHRSDSDGLIAEART